MRDTVMRCGRIASLAVLVLALSMPSGSVHAQELTEGSSQSIKEYSIVLSGSIGKEAFTGVRGTLSVGPPPPVSLNPYLLIVKGFPKENSRNAFYWNSEDSYMTVLSNQITCDLKPTWAKFRNIHFFYLSPALLEKRVFMTQREWERKKDAEKIALPTKVFAQVGKLSVGFDGDGVSGSIWLKGYDPVEHAWVQYSAKFSGRGAVRVEPRRPGKDGG